MENQITLKKDKHDSKYFGMKVGNLSYSGSPELSKDKIISMLDDTLKKAGTQGYEYLVFSIGDRQKFLRNILKMRSFEPSASYVDFKLSTNRIGRTEPGGTYDISKAQKNDLPGIGDIAKVAFRRSRLYHIRSATMNKVDNYHILWVNNLFKNTESEVFTARKGGKVKAFLAATVCRDKGFVRINLIAVSSRMRGKGVGSELMKYFFEWAKSKKIKTIYVKTQEDNRQARAFYTARGFSLYSSDLKYHKYL